MTHRCLGERVRRGAKGGTLLLAEWTDQTGQCKARRTASEWAEGGPGSCAVIIAKERRKFMETVTIGTKFYSLLIWRHVGFW